MPNITESINTVLNRFGEFLNVFDLSFFLSGLTGLAAILLWLVYNQIIQLQDITEMAVLIALAVASYILGLICFSIGRWIRKDILKKGRNREYIREALIAHGLDTVAPCRGYLVRQGHDALNHLYARMWAVIRHKPECSASLTLLNRYWVIAAAFDGLAVALVFWIALLLYIAFTPLQGVVLSPIMTGGMILFLVLAIRICFREGYRSECHLIEELTATIAALEDPAENAGEEDHVTSVVAS